MHSHCVYRSMCWSESRWAMMHVFTLNLTLFNTMTVFICSWRSFGFITKWNEAGEVVQAWVLSVLFSLCCCHVWCHTWMLSCHMLWDFKSWNLSCFRLLRQPAVTCCNWSKSLNHLKNVLILETNGIRVEFNLDGDHLFLLDKGLAVWSGPWFRVRFYSCNFGLD